MKEKEEYRLEFHKADTDHDGLITGVQAATLFFSTGLSKDDLTKIWGLADVNADRYLDVEEFAIAKHLIQLRNRGLQLPEKLSEYMVPMQRKWEVSPPQKDELHNLFSEIDTDKDGFITGKEYHSLVTVQFLNLPLNL